jgi:hypothetical protein
MSKKRRVDGHSHKGEEDKRQGRNESFAKNFVKNKTPTIK